MKTAIQELIEKIQYSIDVQSGVSLTETQVNTLKAVMLVAENLLEKEKEQIITDYSNGLLYALGYKHQDKNIDYGVTMQSKAEADIYYNQTYDQNK